MSATTNGAGESRAVSIVVGRVVLNGDLVIPPRARGVVLFAHGSGSSRHSPRNQFVARELQKGGLATLLIDLLTPAEEAIDQQTRHLRFDIRLLADRLIGGIAWLAAQPATRELRIGLFGASTGAAAAILAAAERQHTAGAVVSRGGRPDLAGRAALRAVRAPTFLIVGERDPEVIRLNRVAFTELRATKDLVIVPAASHLFEEPGTLEQVAGLARDWFAGHLVPAGSPSVVFAPPDGQAEATDQESGT
ncbi:MAG TPA: alpha/beta family hydrolase [Thermomicrobiales bacterium]|nr:alpha/beta family hydrolase [Thermomicrobiales bacterium]